MKGKLLLSAAALAASMCPAAAQAPGAAAGETAARAADEIIVTARRREESLQEVPAAVSALTDEDIERRGGITDARDLAYMLPGVAYSDTQSFNAELNFRGAGAGTSRIQGADAPVAVLRDGASITVGELGGRIYTRTDLFDAQRIEAIRGPQGSLYGVNAVGGVFQVLSKRPKDEFGGSAKVTWSPEIQRTATDAILNVPVLDNLAFRFGAQSVNKEKGFFYNVIDRNYGDVEAYTAFRASALWKPLADVQIFSIFDYSGETTHNNIINSTTQLNDPTATPRPPDPDGPFYFGHNAPYNSDRWLRNWLTEVTWDTGFGELTSVTLVRNRETRWGQDLDNSAPGYSMPPNPVATCATRSCEFFFYDDSNLVSEDIKFDTDLTDTLSAQFGGNIMGKDARYYTSVFGRTTSAVDFTPHPTQNFSGVTSEQEQAWGVFTSLSWQATEDFSIDAAVRYGHQDKVYYAYTVARGTDPNACPFEKPLDNDLPASCMTRVANFDGSFNSLTPSIALRYDLTDHFRVFASFARGDRAGGFNANSLVDPTIPERFKPEKGTAYEAGAKWEIGSTNFAASAYFNQFDDLLVGLNQLTAALTVLPYRFNAGAAESYGIDFELFGRYQTGDGSQWSYNFAANWFEGEITDGPYKGFVIENIPDYIVTAGLNWKRPIFADWSAYAGINYRGQWGGYTGFSVFNNMTKTADISLFAGRVGVDNGAWRFELSAENLFDDVYEVTRDATRSVWGDPMEVRLSLSYAFGGERR